jgi:hypothetical protein
MLSQPAEKLVERFSKSCLVSDHGFAGCGETRCFVSGHDFSRAANATKTMTGFTGCGKTQNGGRRGFQPPHKASKIYAGFSPGRKFPFKSTRNPGIFRNMFSRAANATKTTTGFSP